MIKLINTSVGGGTTVLFFINRISHAVETKEELERRVSGEEAHVGRADSGSTWLVRDCRGIDSTG